MANKNRGEHDLTIDDEHFTLVLTLGDLENIESDLGMGAMGLFQLMREQKAGVGQVRTILRRGFRSVQPRRKPEQINGLLDRVPWTDQYTAALMLLAGALNLLDEQQEPKPEDLNGVDHAESSRPLSSPSASPGGTTES